jgi:hypothetical protein
MSNRPIAVPQEKVSFQIRAYDARILAAPPICAQWSPISSSEKYGHSDFPCVVPKRPSKGEAIESSLDWVCQDHAYWR